MRSADLATLKAITRLEPDRDWQAFVEWLETAACEAVAELLAVAGTEHLPEMRREAALLRELTETIRTAAETVRSANEISILGTPHFGGSQADSEHPQGLTGGQ